MGRGYLSPATGSMHTLDLNRKAWYFKLDSPFSAELLEWRLKLLSDWTLHRYPTGKPAQSGGGQGTFTQFV